MKNTFLFIVSLLFGHLAIAERPMNELPMYGGQHDPTVEQNTDFSKRSVQLAWQYYYKGDFNTAIKRFNQGWMFNRENPEVYWGFGLIMGQRAFQEEPEHNLKESIRFLQLANEKDPKNGKIIGDLAYSHTVLVKYYKSRKTDPKLAKEHFDKAKELFIKAHEVEPKDQQVIANWSILYFNTGNYQEAKSKADEAIKMATNSAPITLKT
jgi:tetratricopeptide (TPR) repeat protein